MSVITVSLAHVRDNRWAPMIRMRGNWVGEIFEVGTKVRCVREQRNGKYILVLEPLTKDETQMPVSLQDPMLNPRTVLQKLTLAMQENAEHETAYDEIAAEIEAQEECKHQNIQKYPDGVFVCQDCGKSWDG